MSAPPREVPSSFVKTNPVTPADLMNSSACLIAFWPVFASSTNKTSSGLRPSARSVIVTTFFNCAINVPFVCCRPAVSAKT